MVPKAPLHPTALNDESGPFSKGGYRLAALPQKKTASDLPVLLCLSGGGERAAAIGYGVLKGPRDFDLSDHGEEMNERIDLTRVRRILLISADGQAAIIAAGARNPKLSSFGQILNAASGTQIDSYNFETMILASHQVGMLCDAIRKQRCSRDARGKNPCDDVQSCVVHLSLADITDGETRKRLQAIPTGLDLEPDDLTRLVQPGEQQVRASAGSAQFRGQSYSNVSKTVTQP